MPLTITYMENGIQKQTTYNVVIADSIIRINSVNLPKRDYKYNEELDLTGATINVEMGSGPKEVQLTKAMISGYNKTELGDQDLVITYDGKTYGTEAGKKVTVNVKDYVDKITLNPDTITGAVNTELSTLLGDNTVMYTVHYAKAGNKAPAPVTAGMVEGYNKTTTALQNLVVKYRDTDASSATNGKDISTNIKITLENSIKSVAIQKPTKDTFDHGETFSLAGGNILITYADGTTSNLSISNATVTYADGTAPVTTSPNASEYDATQKVTKQIKLSYTSANGKSDDITYPIVITNRVESIRIHSTNHQISYNVNEPLNLDNLEIAVKRKASEAEEIITVKGNGKITNTGFTSAVENNNVPVTLTFTENRNIKTSDILCNSCR